MSEGGEAPEVEAQPVVAAPAPAAEMDVNTALTKVLKAANANNGLKRGLHESCRALEAGDALLCILAENLNEIPDYERLVKALCAEKGVNLLSVSENKQLGEWAGLCKYDSEGNARKVVACSCCVITDYGDDTDALAVLQNYLKKQNA